MSRVGNKPVSLPKGVSVTLTGATLAVKGPKGELKREMPSGIAVTVSDSAVAFSRSSDAPEVRALHGLARALTANMVKGVSVGFEKKLELQGIGYKAETKGSNLSMNLGFSHPVEFPFPPGVTIKVDAATKISVLGIDSEAVGQAAAKIRAFRSPDSYKGKGVRYVGERVRLKAGKSQ